MGHLLENGRSGHRQEHGEHAVEPGDVRVNRFTNNYNTYGKQKREEARSAAGNRCIRCGHPYEAGKHGKGEWTPCDERCSHDGPVRTVDGRTEAQWRVLTVHHFDGDKANDAWWNLLALCQRCHLAFQTKVDPEQPYFFEHSEWLKPYVAGFYAKKYLGINITREQAVFRMDELLAFEQRVKV